MKRFHAIYRKLLSPKPRVTLLLVLDADGLTAEVNGTESPVTTREFSILYKLLSYPKKTFSRAQLMDEFWG